MISTHAFGILRPVQHFYRSTFLFDRTGISWHGISVYRWNFASLTKCTLKLRGCCVGICLQNKPLSWPCLHVKLQAWSKEWATGDGSLHFWLCFLRAHQALTGLSMRTGTIPLVSHFPWHCESFPLRFLSRMRRKGGASCYSPWQTPNLCTMSCYGVGVMWSVDTDLNEQMPEETSCTLGFGMDTLLVSNNGATWIVFVWFVVWVPMLD